jgi:thiol-disulfide isomerase/thioredoxin
MKITKSQRNNILFLIILSLLIIPQTRQPIQVFLQKGLALFSPSKIDVDEQKTLSSYQWKLKDLDGHVVDFEEAKGKVVLINFWATWCPPCIAEMPSMQKLYDDYKEKVVFVFVSNESQETLQNFLNENHYNFKVYNKMSKDPETFDVSSIPRTFLIDRKGTIIIDKSGAANWNSESVRNTLDSLLL